MSRRNPVRREAIVQPPTEKMLRTMRDMRVGLAGFGRRRQRRARPPVNRRAEALPLDRSLRAGRQAGLAAGELLVFGPRRLAPGFGGLTLRHGLRRERRPD